MVIWKRETANKYGKINLEETVHRRKKTSRNIIILGKIRYCACEKARVIKRNMQRTKTFPRD